MMVVVHFCCDAFNCTQCMYCNRYEHNSFTNHCLHAHRATVPYPAGARTYKI